MASTRGTTSAWGAPRDWSIFSSSAFRAITNLWAFTGNRGRTAYLSLAMGSGVPTRADADAIDKLFYDEQFFKTLGLRLDEISAANADPRRGVTVAEEEENLSLREQCESEIALVEPISFDEMDSILSSQDSELGIEVDPVLDSLSSSDGRRSPSPALDELCEHTTCSERRQSSSEREKQLKCGHAIDEVILDNSHASESEGYESAEPLNTAKAD